MSTNLYETLGLKGTESQDEIKKQYKKLAMKYHPDRNPGDTKAEAKFKDIKFAYEKLVAGETSYTNSYNSTYGRQSGYKQPPPSPFTDTRADIYVRGNVSLRQAYNGTTFNVRYQRIERCGMCDGSGAKNPDKITKCSNCSGTGRTHGLPGVPNSGYPCFECGGRGKKISDPCTYCNDGGLTTTITEAVTLPKGSDPSETIIHMRMGNYDFLSKKYGDLHIFVNVESDPVFTRNGNDLHRTVLCDYPTLCLGGYVTVETLDGNIRVMIQPGTQIGAVYSVAGKGMTDKNVLLLTVDFKIPKNIFDEERALLEKLKELEERK